MRQLLNIDFIVFCVLHGIDPEWSGGVKIFFFACLFLPCGFSYRETFTNFLNSDKYASYNLIKYFKC